MDEDREERRAARRRIVMLLVAVTGFDMVVEIEPDGTVLNEWNVLGQDPYQRVSLEVEAKKLNEWDMNTLIKE